MSVSKTQKLKNRIGRLLADDKTGAQLFLFAFAVFLCEEALGTTMFQIPGTVYVGLKAVALVLVLAKIVLFDRYEPRNFWIMICLFAVGILILAASGYTEAIMWICMLMGAKDVPFKKILQIYLIISVSIVLLAFCASLIGVIENLQYERDEGYIVRNSFGILYTTDFASHIFSIVLVSFYLLKDRLRIYHYIIALVLAGLIYRFCYTRVDVLCILLLVVVFAGVNIWERSRLLSKGFRIRERNTALLHWCMPFFAAVMFILTVFYSTENRLIYHIDQILSSRLKLGQQGLQRFGVTLFGQYAPMEGFGGTTVHLRDYFFVDCSYLYIMIRYGIIFLLIVLAVFVICCRKMQKDYYFIAAIFVISINCMIAHHIVELAYCPFALALFAAMPGLSSKGKISLWEQSSK